MNLDKIDWANLSFPSDRITVGDLRRRYAAPDKTSDHVPQSNWSSEIFIAKADFDGIKEHPDNISLLVEDREFRQKLDIQDSLVGLMRSERRYVEILYTLNDLESYLSNTSRKSSAKSPSNLTSFAQNLKHERVHLEKSLTEQWVVFGLAKGPKDSEHLLCAFQKSSAEHIYGRSGQRGV